LFETLSFISANKGDFKLSINPSLFEEPAIPMAARMKTLRQYHMQARSPGCDTKGDPGKFPPICRIETSGEPSMVLLMFSYLGSVSLDAIKSKT
jgi:hypothetical protein